MRHLDADHQKESPTKFLPFTALADKAVLLLRVLIGGSNVVATDLVGARVFGLTTEDVPDKYPYDL